MDKILSDKKKWLWNEGKYHRAYELLGAHPVKEDGMEGVRFTVWAPNAHRVSVVGDFNSWNGDANIMDKDDDTGLWSTFVPHVDQWAIYKYEIKTAEHAPPFLKADPYAYVSELRPKVASLVYDLDHYEWSDDQWLKERGERQKTDQPISIYEVHLGSWRRKGEHQEYLTYRELADELVSYVSEMGFTHIELMPVAEHPFDPSWGYQVMGYFAPTSRFGDPDDFRYFVEQCHNNGIGIILDWVPAHFPRDEQGLQMYDGSPLYEYEDPKRREQKDWGTHIFDYGKAGVRNFLLSNALFWCDKYHIDGLRVDAVAAMLYLDYSKEEGEWSPNKYGGHEHLEAIEFLKQFNAMMHKEYPGVLTFAEESTSWPGVTHPTEHGGLGFDFKWNMGWMNDTLTYMEMGVDKRRVYADNITFPMVYSLSEKFVLPLSHDEVVHMKKPLIYKSPGEHEQQFPNLRLLFVYQMGHPGKKLLFMGGEFAQTSEWAEDRSLDWHLLEFEPHRGVKRLYKDLLSLYRREASLHEQDDRQEGFEWTDLGRTHGGVFSFLRKAKDPSNHLLFILNFSDDMIGEYKPGPFQGVDYKVILNSDSRFYGGDDRGGIIDRFNNSIPVAPFSGLVLKPEDK
ncbi:1,4-alpha-glucan branching protein GlgB [Halalkalibaculum sp. DA3122]|uniref:1,4-alpha-glucan branching protein GlgB n=1 Tax=Halalkalibaculum sp. DA3122 TaxID=3373607 RepID=UPI0037544FF1